MGIVGREESKADSIAGKEAPVVASSCSSFLYIERASHPSSRLQISWQTDMIPMAELVLKEERSGQLMGKYECPKRWEATESVTNKWSEGGLGARYPRDYRRPLNIRRDFTSMPLDIDEPTWGLHPMPTLTTSWRLGR
jgi:hypothetical protein